MLEQTASEDVPSSLVACDTANNDRAWSRTRLSSAGNPVFYDLTAEIREEIGHAVDELRRRNVTWVSSRGRISAYRASGATFQKAGCPMTDEERTILDYLDSLFAREEFDFTYKLEAGEILLNNNWTLHGRKACEDHAEPDGKRLLMRIWLWRRHRWPGTNPLELDVADFASAH